MMSCKEVVKSVSSEADLSFIRRAELKLHLMMCHHCSRYVNHLAMIKRSAITLFRERAGAIDRPNVEKLERDVIEKATSGLR